MVQPSKKEIRKSVKGKTKAIPSPAKASSPDIEVDEEESEWSDEDEDEENGGVSEKGMKRLMELVGEGDLDDFEMGMLAAQDGEDEDDEDVDDDDEEEEEDEDEDMEDLDASDEEEVSSVVHNTTTKLISRWTTPFSLKKPTLKQFDSTTSNQTPQ
jgi:rRNA-processing protein EBP2